MDWTSILFVLLGMVVAICLMMLIIFILKTITKKKDQENTHSTTKQSQHEPIHYPPSPEQTVIIKKTVTTHHKHVENGETTPLFEVNDSSEANDQHQIINSSESNSNLVTKEDILDYMEFIKQSEILFSRYTPGSGVIFRQRGSYSDSLHYLHQSFALLAKQKEKLILKLKLGNLTLKAAKQLHPQLQNAKFPNEQYWFDLILDDKVILNDVTKLLDYAYCLCVNEYHDHSLDLDLMNLLSLDRQMLIANHLTNLTRVISHLEKNLLDGDHITLNKHHHLPVKLEVEHHAYALVYEKMHFSIKGETNLYLQLILKLGDKELSEIKAEHPNTIKAKFPKGDDWYLVPIDATFERTSQIYSLINKARRYVIKKEQIKRDIIQDFIEAADHEME